MATAKSERAEIKRDGGRAQKNSGRGSHDKGDATLGPFLYDVKEYEKSYGLSLTNWSKVCTDAFRSGNKVPALKIVLGKMGAGRIRLWVISDSMFQEMYEAWEQVYGEQD